MVTIETSRFGPVRIDPSRLIRFPHGLVGLPHWEYYALIQTSEDNGFLWLQSTQLPELAFVVCDPTVFLSDYRVKLKQEDRKELRLRAGKNAETLVICNKVDDKLTANLRGPLVINSEGLLGKQMVLSDRRYATRHAVMHLEVVKDVAAAKTA